MTHYKGTYLSQTIYLLFKLKKLIKLKKFKFSNGNQSLMVLENFNISDFLNYILFIVLT